MPAFDSAPVMNRFSASSNSWLLATQLVRCLASRAAFSMYAFSRSASIGHAPIAV